MFSEKDKQQIQERGSKLETVQIQIENFKKGFPYLPIQDAASVKKGIIRLSPEDLKKRGERYDAKIEAGTKALKFVPASGAASRMFKALFQALEDFQNQPHEDVLAADLQEATTIPVGHLGSCRFRGVRGHRAASAGRGSPGRAGVEEHHAQGHDGAGDGLVVVIHMQTGDE